MPARFVTGPRRPNHPVRGTEFAGGIEALGSEVTEFSAGDLVFGFNEATLGARAEYLVMPASGPLATIPTGMTPAEVAPTTEGAHYALSCLEKIEVGPGHEVLVHGASGAIGTAAVQLLKHRGATVTAVCDARGMDMVTSLGADLVIDRTAEDLTETAGPHDVVLEAVGKSDAPEPWHRPGRVARRRGGARGTSALSTEQPRTVCDRPRFAVRSHGEPPPTDEGLPAEASGAAFGGGIRA